jgi:hypothetical protein
MSFDLHAKEWNRHSNSSNHSMYWVLMRCWQDWVLTQPSNAVTLAGHMQERPTSQ